MMRLWALAVVVAASLPLLSPLPAVADSQQVSHPSPRAVTAASDSSVPVEFSLIADQVGADGRWTQTFRVHVNPGGTLADISELVYGNGGHIDDLFAAIRQQHPDLRSPASVPADLEADITLDPREAFVPRDIVVDAQRGATTFSYYNGARRVVYHPKQAGDHKGLSAIVDLPADRPANQFTILEGDLPVVVQAGVRVAYYDFQGSDKVNGVVAEIYGQASIRAIGDFLNQTDWDPNRWPPGPLARSQRLVIPLKVDFSDDAISPIDVSSGNPAAGVKLQAQLAERAKAGVYPIRRQSYGTVYHVAVLDFDITARQVAKLLYSTDDQYLSIAATAGFGTLHDLMQSPPQDVRLFGRSFDVAVDYEQEHFPASATPTDSGGKRTTLLLNGTVIEEWTLEAGKNGLLRQIDLPSGYRKMLYRPHTTTVLAGQILYALISLGGSSNPQVHQDEEGRFVSGLIWTYGPSTPKKSTDVLDYGRLLEVPTADGKMDQLMELAVRSSTETNLTSRGRYLEMLSNPLLLGVAAVLAGLVTLAMFGFVARRVQD